MATINSRHPARDRIASLATYHDSKIGALHDIENILDEYELQFDPSYTSFGLGGDEGHINIPLKTLNPAGITCDCCLEKEKTVDNVIVFAWYKMPSGRWEINAYLS